MKKLRIWTLHSVLKQQIIRKILPSDLKSSYLENFGKSDYEAKRLVAKIQFLSCKLHVVYRAKNVCHYSLKFPVYLFHRTKDEVSLERFF